MGNRTAKVTAFGLNKANKVVSPVRRKVRHFRDNVRSEILNDTERVNQRRAMREATKAAKAQAAEVMSQLVNAAKS